jgi:cold shock CspA family protein
MTDPSPTSDPSPASEIGTVRWFDATKRIGVITRADGTTIFIPPKSLGAVQTALVPGQFVSFVVRANTTGDYAAKVRVTDELPPGEAEIIPLAEALKEDTPHAMEQIRRIVRHLGLAATQTTVAEAIEVEAAGGMQVPNSARRRTLGGVFFYLVRQRLSPEEQAIIFPPLANRKPKKPTANAAGQATAPAAPTPPSAMWEDRHALITSLQAASGKVTTVKVTLIGRPARVSEQAQFTLLTLTYTGPLPALPKGIPVPTTVPPTTYSVYVGKKQWKQVAEALTNPEDVLIVEGIPVLDAATTTISVFATKTTTKLLQQASRPPKPPEA